MKLGEIKENNRIQKLADREIKYRNDSYRLLKQVIRDIISVILTGKECRMGGGNGKISEYTFAVVLTKRHQRILKMWIKKEDLRFRDVVYKNRFITPPTRTI